LDAKDIRKIADLQMKSVERRLEDRDYHLEITDGVLEFLSKVGYDPVFGARPLKRAIQTYVENPLAEEILSGKYLPGDTIVARCEGDHLVFDKK
jgi:ATP-dependent Clp protease ATP-binding subunit ClpB